MPDLPPNTGLPGLQIFKTLPLGLPQTTTKNLFNIVNGGTYGPVYASLVIEFLFGIVTTAIGAVANATKLQGLMDALAAVDLCATADVNAAAVGTLFSISGTATDAAVLGVNGVQTGQANQKMIKMSGGSGPNTGNIVLNCAGSDGGVGRIVWVMGCYLPYGTRIVPQAS